MFQIPLYNRDTTLNYALNRWQRSRSFEKKNLFSNRFRTEIFNSGNSDSFVKVQSNYNDWIQLGHYNQG